MHCVGCSATACFSLAEISFQWGGGCALPSILLVFVLQKIPEHTFRKWDIAGLLSMPGLQSEDGHQAPAAENELLPLLDIFPCSCVVKTKSSPRLQIHVQQWWQVVGKTSSGQRSAMPLACSCSSPAVACELNFGQTAACDSLPCVMWEVAKWRSGWCYMQTGQCLDTH